MNKNQKSKLLVGIVAGVPGSAAIAATLATSIQITKKETVISSDVTDLLSGDEKTQKLITSNIDISNTKVVLDNNFSTTLTVKQESLSNYEIGGVKVYTYKDTTNSNSKSNKTKVELAEGTDYEFVNEKKSATLTVFAQSFNDKLELDISLKEISFEPIITYDDVQVNYDGNAHSISYSFKEDHTSLPEGTTITYSWKDQSQATPFEFTIAGVYEVKLTLTCDGYNTFEKTCTLTINKIGLPSELQSKYQYINTVSEVKSIATPEIKKLEGAIDYINEPVILYSKKDEANWSPTKPTEVGLYDLKATLEFVNYNDFVLKGSMEVTPNWYSIQETHDPNKISSVTLSKQSAHCGDQIIVTGTAVDGYKLDKIKVDGQTYSFTGNTATFTMPEKDVTVEVIASIKKYTLNLSAQDGGKVYTKGTQTVATSIQVEWNTSILDNINNSVEAKLDNAALWGWSLDGGSTVIDSTTVMPTSDKDIVACWRKYTFNFENGDHGTVSGTTSYANKISLSKDEKSVTVNANEGYSFTGEYDVYVDGNKVATTDFSSPLAPANFSAVPEHNKIITIKPTFKINSYKLSLSAQDEGKVYKKGTQTETQFINVTYNESILDNINDSVEAKLTNASLRGWSLDGGTTIITALDKMPALDKNIVACWKKYTFNFEDGDHGTVSGTTSYSDKIWLSGTDISGLTVTANEGYSATGEYDVYVNGSLITTTDFSSVLAPANFATVPAHGATITIKPKFQINTYKLSLSAQDGGKVYAKGTQTETTSINVTYNEPILSNIESSVEAKLTNASLRGWSLDGGTTIITASDKMPASNRDIVACWKKYTFNFEDGDHGTVSGTTSYSDKIWLSSTDISGLTVTANEGYSATGEYDVYVNGSKVTTTKFDDVLAPANFATVPAHGATITIKPTFQINSYTLNLSAQDGGVVYKKDTQTPMSSISVTYNDPILSNIESSVEAKLTNASLRGWSLDGGTTIITASDKMPASNRDIVACWKKYTFAFVNGDHGTVSGTTSYSDKIWLSGTDISGLTVTANEGYSATGEYDVYVNGSLITTTDFSTVLAPANFATVPAHGATITIKPKFEINTYKLSLSAQDGGVVYNKGTQTVASSINVTYHDSILTNIESSVEAKLDNASLRGWSIDGGSSFIDSTTQMPASEKTAVAYWKKYTFQFEDGEHGTVGGTTTYSDKIYLSSTDITALEVTPAEGYSFKGNYDVYVAGTKVTTTKFTDVLAPANFTSIPAHGSTITIKPVFEINSYSVSFNPNGGTLTSDDPINVEYGSKILEASLPTATHSYAKFRCWNDGTSDITSSSTMPAKAITLKAMWDTYNIQVIGENCTIDGSASKTFNDRIILYSDEFTVSPSEHYTFDHYEYSMDGTNYQRLSAMPFKPYALDSTITHGQTVYVKAVCASETVQVFLSANGGTFSSGSDYEVVNIEYGKTWGQIKASLPTPTKTGVTFKYWVDENGNQISDSSIVTSEFIAYAYYE